MSEHRPMKRSPYALDQIEDEVEAEPVRFEDVKLRRRWPELSSGTNGGRPFLLAVAYGTCRFGDCQLVWEVDADDFSGLRWENPDYIYVLTADGWDISVGGEYIG